jgi:hypothetical protein
MRSTNGAALGNILLGATWHRQARMALTSCRKVRGKKGYATIERYEHVALEALPGADASTGMS